jgi:hypothetical protein
MSYYINGSTEIDYSHLASLPQPQSLGNRHYPVHHKTFTDLVLNKTRSLNYTIEEARFGLDDKQNLFGYIKIDKADGSANGVFKHVIGIRNSLCQKFRAGLVAGTSVMVCDNLAFFGEIATGHKNTQHIMDNLPGRIDGMMSQIQDNWKAQAQRYDTYADTKLSEQEAESLVTKACRRNLALPKSRLDDVLDEYENPRHDAFSDRNAWSLFNAFTEILKESPTMLQQRTSRLHNVFDSFCETKTPERLDSLLSLPQTELALS